MSGIYIHIPYCKQACHYCDFHFSTQLGSIHEMVKAIQWELEQRKNFLPEQLIQTIYLGGGTPSILSPSQLEAILDSCLTNYQVELKELTLEVNPDDLNSENLKQWKALGVDRLSIGIQSFNDQVLKFYNRAHNSIEAIKAVDLARSVGFEKLSLDLIYGFPSANHDLWKSDLVTALEFDPGHISSYCLTVEPKTALGTWSKKGRFIEASEEFSAEQFEILQEKTEKAGYIQYEISNFGKENHFAIHNSNYWTGIPYLGIGPGAHSFDGKNRGQNPSNNVVFLKNFRNNKLSFEIDTLSAEDVVNEYLLTSLRTIWGADIQKIIDLGFSDFYTLHQNKLKEYVKEGLMDNDEKRLTLTKKGKLLADSIAASLFI